LHNFAHDLLLPLLSAINVVKSLLDGNRGRHSSNISARLTYRHHIQQLLLSFTQQLKLTLLLGKFASTHTILLLCLHQFVSIHLDVLPVGLVEAGRLRQGPLVAMSSSQEAIFLLLLVDDVLSLVDHVIALLSKVLHSGEDV